MEQPTELTVVKVVPLGVGIAEVYAADPEGNVWQRTEGLATKWKLFKRITELPPVILSFEQMTSRVE